MFHDSFFSFRTFRAAFRSLGCLAIAVLILGGDAAAVAAEVPPSINVQVMSRTTSSTRQSVAPGALVEIVDQRGVVLRFAYADRVQARAYFNSLPVGVPVWVRVSYRGAVQTFGLNTTTGMVPFPNARADRRHFSALMVIR